MFRIYLKYCTLAVLVTVPIFFFQLKYILLLPLTPKFFVLPTIVGILFGFFLAKNKIKNTIIQKQAEALETLNKSLDEKVKARTSALERNLKLLDEYKNAIDSSVLVTKIDSDEDIVYYNSKIHEILGKTVVNLYGNVRKVFANLRVDNNTIESILEAMRTKRTWQNTIVIQPDPEGEELFLFTTIIPIVDREGEIVEYFTISQDQTRIHRLDIENSKKEKMLEIQSRQAQMGEMISSIAHQWKQPLNILALMIQDLEESYNYNEVDKTYIKTYVKNGMDQIEHMVETMESFRRFFIPGKEPVVFNIFDEIDKVRSLIGKHYREARVEIDLEGDREITAEGLPNEFKQVIINILNNARDEIVRKNIENRYISIRVLGEEADPTITITDHAGGIPEQIIDRVFDPFVTTKSESTGTGIGLHMSKLIIENSMKGSISAQNVGDGARFTIRLKHNIKE